MEDRPDGLEEDVTGLEPTPKAYDFNPDPRWQEYVQRFEPVITSIAFKYCADDDLREDCKNEARIALATVRPEKVDGHEAYTRGDLTDAQWEQGLKKYCHNVIRNTVLSYLDPYPTGPWDTGRTRFVRDRQTGSAKKVYLPPRYSSYDQLSDEFGMQVDNAGNISWPDASDDGLLPLHTEPNRYPRSRRWSTDGGTDGD